MVMASSIAVTDARWLQGSLNIRVAPCLIQTEMESTMIRIAANSSLISPDKMVALYRTLITMELMTSSIDVLIPFG